MRVAAIADLHGWLPVPPSCDVVVLAGDLCPTADHSTMYQHWWLDRVFRRWCEGIDALVVGIAGNHDFIFEREPGVVSELELPWNYLQESSVLVDGVEFWGSPWTPWFHDWAFNAPRGETGEEFLGSIFGAVPGSADVVIAHGPPEGFGDLTARGPRVGSFQQRQMLERVQPELHVFGHIHEARGVWRRGGTRIANCSAVDLQYQRREDPWMVFDL